MKTVKQHEFSRYLIYDDTLDNVVGFIHIKDFLLARESRPNAQLKDFIKQPFFVIIHFFILIKCNLLVKLF